ncbi:MAG: hypothetical protein AAGB46_14380 [Verrucomicrobiota bacterium]
MSNYQLPLKKALVEEQSNGRFKLFELENPQVPVSDIEFNNRKAARNWAKSRGVAIGEITPDGRTINGAN